jgi:hypothetical protein
MAKASKYNRARIRSRVRRPKRRSGSMVWTVTTVIVIVVGVLLVVASYADRQEESDVSPVIGDHWHAFLGVDACGTWLPNAPEFEPRANEPGVRAGLHSHGDGLMHIHPFSSDEAGAKATVGRFITYGGWELSDSSFKLWDAVARQNGERCGTGADAKKAEVQWAVGQFGKKWTGTPRSGNPADYRPKNGDIVAIYFLPKGDPLPEPPDAEKALTSINDLGGAPVSGSSTTLPGGSTTTAPPLESSSTTVPATGGTTSSSTP